MLFASQMKRRNCFYLKGKEVLLSLKDKEDAFALKEKITFSRKTNEEGAVHILKEKDAVLIKKNEGVVLLYKRLILF